MLVLVRNATGERSRTFSPAHCDENVTNYAYHLRTEQKRRDGKSVQYICAPFIPHLSRGSLELTRTSSSRPRQSPMGQILRLHKHLPRSRPRGKDIGDSREYMADSINGGVSLYGRAKTRAFFAAEINDPDARLLCIPFSRDAEIIFLAQYRAHISRNNYESRLSGRRRRYK